MVAPRRVHNWLLRGVLFWLSFSLTFTSVALSSLLDRRVVAQQKEHAVLERDLRLSSFVCCSGRFFGLRSRGGGFVGDGVLL